MRDQVFEYFLERPQRLRSLGRTLFSLGSWIALFALTGRVVVLTNLRLPQALRTPEPLSLAALYPALPTWWIPETPVAAICTLAVILFGIWLSAVGSRLDNALRWI
jgi:hypothetical protein